MNKQRIKIIRCSKIKEKKNLGRFLSRWDAKGRVQSVEEEKEEALQIEIQHFIK